jgi:hypothetical protein
VGRRRMTKRIEMEVTMKGGVESKVDGEDKNYSRSKHESSVLRYVIENVHPFHIFSDENQILSL